MVGSSMRERFARWLLLNLAVAVTLLGRPGGERLQSPMQEEALRAIAGDTSMMSEERRVPGLKRSGEAVRSNKAGPTTLVAILAPLRTKLVTSITIDDWRPTPTPTSRGREQHAPAYARGPPTFVA